METQLIIVDEYCTKSHIEPSFVYRLEEGGLINVQQIEGERYLDIAEVPDLERFSRMYYDLSINIEGIDAINQLLDQLKLLRTELEDLRHRLRLYESPDDGFLL